MPLKGTHEIIQTLFQRSHFIKISRSLQNSYLAEAHGTTCSKFKNYPQFMISVKQNGEMLTQETIFPQKTILLKVFGSTFWFYFEDLLQSFTYTDFTQMG